MGMDGSGLSVADALALQDRNGNDGMMGGGSGMWMMMFLFFILALGGNGGGLFGGGNNAAQGALTRSELCQDMNFQSLENAVRGIQNGLCDGFYAQNTTMLQGFNGIQSSLCNGFNGLNNSVTESRFAAQQCCCETNRNIDAIRYEAAKNTCDIVNAIRTDGDATRAMMTQNTIQELRDQLQAAQLTIGNAAQTQTLVDQLRPCAKPAYITCSPYQAMGYPYGGDGFGRDGFNRGCCGC